MLPLILKRLGKFWFSWPFTPRVSVTQSTGTIYSRGMAEFALDSMYLNDNSIWLISDNARMNFHFGEYEIILLSGFVMLVLLRELDSIWHWSAVTFNL